MLEAFALSDKGCVRTNNEDYCLIEPEPGTVRAGGRDGRRQGRRTGIPHGGGYGGGDGARGAARAIRRCCCGPWKRPTAACSRRPTAIPAWKAWAPPWWPPRSGRRHRHRQRGRQPRLPAGRRAASAPITDDQTWVNEVGRPLGLDEESLRNHPMRHVLTMAIGASAPLTVNYYSVPLRPGALVLMCSDGLHGVVEAPQLERILRGRAQRHGAGRKLPPVDRGGQGSRRSGQHHRRAGAKDLGPDREIIVPNAGDRSLTVAALNVHRSRDRKGAVGTIIPEQALSPVTGAHAAPRLVFRTAAILAPSCAAVKGF